MGERGRRGPQKGAHLCGSCRNPGTYEATAINLRPSIFPESDLAGLVRLGLLAGCSQLAIGERVKTRWLGVPCPPGRQGAGAAHRDQGPGGHGGPEQVVAETSVLSPWVVTGRVPLVANHRKCSSAGQKGKATIILSRQ